ncbi:MAG: amidohydrolase family protein [Alphaproteobacteria bacterium]|nr:amidohydrolase family protein [Alphaproteobacteria bacterium]MCB9793418.1 amidohydrolase family protein [Alphaproteobacteria bacterium]
MTLLWMSLLACAGPQAAPESPADTLVEGAQDGDLVLRGGHVVGQGVVDLLLRAGRVEAAGGEMPEDAEVIDLTGKWVTPAFIDSHVHLAYWQVAEELPGAGLAAAVDLAAPQAWIGQGAPGLEVLWSGPMVTGVGGYPTQGWGRDGYGLECADAEAAVAAVDLLVDAGARVIKLPLTGSGDLPAQAMAAAASRAEARGVPSVSHALSDAEAQAARDAGVKVLAHTPTGALQASTVAAWADGAVITTLSAFGGRATTVDNLAQLRAAGATVLYGTDLGNARVAGISEDEIALMMQAGMGGAEILAAGTATPAAFWGLPELGEVEPGKAAALLVLDADPLLDPLTLAHPARVFTTATR